jgi:hypothetical protein
VTTLLCAYCKKGQAMREAGLPPGARATIAWATVHDMRGCMHVCVGHARWRSTTSLSVGRHSADCPFADGADDSFSGPPSHVKTRS